MISLQYATSKSYEHISHFEVSNHKVKSYDPLLGNPDTFSYPNSPYFLSQPPTTSPC